MIKTADNMPETAVAPSEQDTLARLALAAERCAAALEILADDAMRQAGTCYVKTPGAPLRVIDPGALGEPPLSVRDVLSAGAAKLMETPHACEDRDARLSDDGAWLVCAVCSKRTRYAKLEPEKMKNEDARGASSSGTEAAAPAAVKPANPAAASPSHAAGPSEPQAPAGGPATTPAGAPSQSAKTCAKCKQPSADLQRVTVVRSMSAKCAMAGEFDLCPECRAKVSSNGGGASQAVSLADSPSAPAAGVGSSDAPSPPSQHGVDLDAAMRERARIARGLPAPLAAKVAAMSDDEIADKDVALEIKHYASGLLTPDGFAKARTALGVKPKALPTGLQLKRLAVEVLAAELDAREKTTAAAKGSGSPW